MRALGFRLDGSTLLGCLTDVEGRILARAVRPAGRGTGPDRARALILETADELRGHIRIDRVGVGLPGVIDRDRGVVRSSATLEGWEDVAFARQLTETLGRPTIVDSDVNAAAFAELELRREAPPEAMLYVSVNATIGSAIIVGRRLWRGSSGAAGALGDVSLDPEGRMCHCGRRGCLNTFASEEAIQQELELPPGTPLSAVANRNDPRVMWVLERAADHLGVGIANALNLLNPDLVVLGGAAAQLGVRFLENVQKAARREATDEVGQCRFEPGIAGYESAAVGAALLAIEG